MLFWHFFRHLILSSRAGSLIRRIAFLSAGAIALSVFAFLVVLFVMNGMNSSIRDRLVALEPHIVVHKKGVTQAAELQSQAAFQNLEKDPSLRVSYFESQDVILQTVDGQFRGAVARGLDEKGLREFLQELGRIQAKTNPEFDWTLEDLPGPGEVIVGIDLARSLGLIEGDPIAVLAPESLLLPPGEAPISEKLRVKKIIATNLSDLDAQLFSYVRGKALTALAGSPARSAGMEIRLSDPDLAEGWKKTFDTLPGVQVETWGERNSALFFALKMEKTMIGVFLGLAGLIAGSSILTVMALLLSQKRRDIALLRVLGLSISRTVDLFSKMGLLLAGGSVVVGSLLGAAVGLWVERHPLRILPEIYYDAEIPARFDGLLLGLTLLVAFGLAYWGARGPSQGVADIDPSRVLRQKN